VRYFKEDEEGVSSMCRAMEQMRAEAAAEAAAEAEARGEARGKITGIIEFCFDEGKTFDETVSIVTKRSTLSLEEATALLSEYYG
jgi:hypothetical protein